MTPETNISAFNSLPVMEDMLQMDLLIKSNLLDMLPVAVCMYDADGVIRNYNSRAVQLWGRSPLVGDKGEHFSKTFMSYYPDGDIMPQDKTPMATCLANGFPVNDVEVIIERPDMSRLPVLASMKPVKTADNTVAGVVVSFHDMTQQKSFLRAGNNRYLQLMQELPAAIYTTDTHGYIISYNKAAASLWGREPVPGKDLWCGSWKIYTVGGQPMSLENCPMAISLKEKKPVSGEEIVIERPDGSKRHVMPYPQPLFDEWGRITGGVNMLIDITEIKESQKALLANEGRLRDMANRLEKEVEERTRDLQRKNEELQRSEERYHKMIEEVEDYAILLLNKDGIIQNWNKGAEKIKGYKEKEIVGKHFRIFYLPADQKDMVPENLIAKAINSGKAMHEGWRVRKDGTRFWGSIVITALHDDQGNVIGFSKVTRDLTEKKVAEDKIRQYTSDLEFQNKELEQFAYAAAHDMKEPLRKIQFYNTYIFEHAGSYMQEKERDYLNRSVAAATRMRNLIDDLLSYSKTSSQSEPFELVDLQKVLEDVLLLHHDTILEANADVQHDPLPTVHGVAFQLAQLFDNLIGNSIKYRHPGRQLRIKITLDQVSGSSIKDPQADAFTSFYRISFADNGIGFESHHSATIFGLFQRLHDRARYSGTGIGLAICKKIVQNHKGFLTAQGVPDNGATFHVYIPSR